MEAFFEQIIAGVATGCIYACIALALVVTYKATRVVNFAQGALVTLSVYFAWMLMNAGIGYWPSVLVALACAFIFGALIEVCFVTPADDMPTLAKVIFTLGLALIIESCLGWKFSYDTKEFPSLLSGPPVNIGKITIVANDVGIFIATGLVMACLFLFFRFTKLGLIMRAVAYNTEISRMMGIRVRLILAFGWGLAAVIGAIAGILIAPSVFLSPHMMHGVMIYGIAAATLGGLDSPVGAAFGGILLGVVENLAGTYIIGPSLKLSVAMLAIFIVLLIKPEGIFGKREIERV